MAIVGICTAGTNLTNDLGNSGPVSKPRFWPYRCSRPHHSTTFLRLYSDWGVKSVDTGRAAKRAFSLVQNSSSSIAIVSLPLETLRCAQRTAAVCDALCSHVWSQCHACLLSKDRPVFLSVRQRLLKKRYKRRNTKVFLCGNRFFITTASYLTQ